MRFSKRTSWNTQESALALAHRLRVEAGLPIADLTASNPTRCGFHFAQDLLETLTDKRVLDYDPQPRGLLRAREAVCGYYAERGVTVAPEQVVLTTSTSEAYSFLFRMLCDQGSEIVVPQPGYPLFDFLAGLDDVRLKFCAAGLRPRLADRPGGISPRNYAGDARNCPGASEQPDGTLHEDMGDGRVGADLPGA